MRTLKRPNPSHHVATANGGRQRLDFSFFTPFISIFKDLTLSTMKNQKESLPLLLDLILAEKNSDDTNDSRLGLRGSTRAKTCHFGARR
ncbi:hypothetical protein ES319_A04G039600v1 [Gossypium barbadense]|uniref:Uncharacterized protein n=1 Tax=Gossypium barbadense TaxID=3634 RepID=A0A5J5W3G3_GOSBA|nr:hypothetical protein ES319_A04G039600v1 [Gossypium barbadense]